MEQKIIDLVVSAIAAAGAVALSWPFFRNYEYFAESKAAWTFYFILGFLICTYIFFIFLNSLRVLFTHDRLLKSGNLPEKNTTGGNEK